MSAADCQVVAGGDLRQLPLLDLLNRASRTLKEPMDCLAWTPACTFSLWRFSSEDSLPIIGKNFSDFMHWTDLMSLSGMCGMLPFSCTCDSKIVTFLDFGRYCDYGKCLFRSFSTRGTRMVYNSSMECSSSSMTGCLCRRLLSSLSAVHRSR